MTVTHALDRAAAVAQALQEAGELANGERIETITHLAGGWSRHSYVASTASGTAGPRQFVIRVCPPGALLDTDLGVEFALYRRLRAVDVPTPTPYALAEEPETPFGGPFIVMEYLPGRAPSCYARSDWRRHTEDWNGERTLAREAVEYLARIHSVTEDLPVSLPRFDFDAAVDRWRESYERHRLIRDPVIEEAFAWIAERRPSDTWTGLVHGDYRLDNMLLEDGHIRAILDWELAYCGDVRYDLGYLAMPRTAGKHLRSVCPLMATFAEQAWFMDRYAELTGRRITDSDLATFEMLGVMMLLSTQLTATWMYAHGQTTDMRMAWGRFSFAGLRQDMIELMQW